MSLLMKLQNTIQRFLSGRNGVDILSRDLNLFALFLMILDSFFNTHVIYWVGLLTFAIAIFRICSFNLAKRSAENMVYYNFRSNFITWFKSKKQHISSKKDYRYYKCSACSQKLRVPKGRGKIEITCPKCGVQFIKKT